MDEKAIGTRSVIDLQSRAMNNAAVPMGLLDCQENYAPRTCNDDSSYPDPNCPWNTSLRFFYLALSLYCTLFNVPDDSLSGEDYK